jgi:hypothetical protein
MADNSLRSRKEQAKRAQRLRQQIEQLKQGRPADETAGRAGSLREQIEARAAEQKKPAEGDQ